MSRPICILCRCPILHFETGVYDPARSEHPWAHETCLLEEFE